eukprot:1616603-Prorocentrum_lima.AAC.1
MGVVDAKVCGARGLLRGHSYVTWGCRSWGLGDALLGMPRGGCWNPSRATAARVASLCVQSGFLA